MESGALKKKGKAGSDESKSDKVSFAVGTRLNVKDKSNRWRPGHVIDSKPGQVLIHFFGWSSDWDQWIVDAGLLSAAKNDQESDALEASCCLMKLSTNVQLGGGVKTWNQPIQMPTVSENIANEIKHREGDIAHFQKLIDGLIVRAQDAGDDAEKVGVDLVSFLGAKGEHVRQVAALKAKQHFTITNQNTFTAQRGGRYRIVVHVNGTTSGANTDGISISVNGSVVARAIAGLHTGHQIAVHLHEVVTLTSGSYFQILQSFNSLNLGSSLDNSLIVELVNRRICHYTASTNHVGAAVKTWVDVQEDKSLVTRSTDGTQFTATKTGLYRIVVKVTGTSSGANVDHIAIQLAGMTIHRSMVGLNTGHQITAHLHEIVPLAAGQAFQVYQCFNAGNLVASTDNTLFVEPVDPKVCRYTATAQSASGWKSWQVVAEDPAWVTRSADGLKFTISKSGQYRVVVKINGASSGANSDHIALHLNGNVIAKAIVGLSTAHQIASHIHEVIAMSGGDCVQVYQQFNGNALGNAMDNTLFFELLDHLEREPEEKKDLSLGGGGDRKCTPQQQLRARSTPSCSFCCHPFLGKLSSKSLSCGHFFCSICIEKHTTVEGIKCPTCSIVSQEPETESEIMNVAMTAHGYSQQIRAAEAEVKEGSHSAPPNCDQCEEVVATVHSDLLKAFLCDSCNKMLSQNKVISRQHTVVSIRDYTPPTLCVAHGRRVKLFCHDDQILICRQCATSSTHKGHLLEDPDVAFKSLVAPNLKELAKNTDIHQANVENLLGKLAKSREQIMSSVETFPQIKKYFKQARAVLDQCEQSTLRSARDHINEVQKELCDAQLSLLTSFANLSKVVDDFNKFQEAKEPISMKDAIEFFDRVANCQSHKTCNFAQDLRISWRPESFNPPKQHLQLPTLRWEKDRRHLLTVEPSVVIKKSTVSQTKAYKSWNQQDRISDLFKFDNDTCLVKKAGLYRVVVRINGTTSGANADHIALHVDSKAINRAYAGLNSGLQIAVHLHELVPLQVEQRLQVYQEFNGANLTQSMDNLIFIEPVTHKVCRYTTTLQQTIGVKNWNSILQEDKSLCICTGQQTFTASEDGLYRVVVCVNGSSSGANSDHISIMVGGTILHRSMVGLNTGYYIAAHLHELILLKKGESFQISQAFNSNNLPATLDNSLFVELANPKTCRYAGDAEASGRKSWRVLSENRSWVTSSADGRTFTIASGGLYRVVVKINGTSSASNSDHIALYVDGTMVARSLIGLNTGHQIASHLHELVHLKASQTFQVHQQFSHHTLGNTFNSLYIERI